MKILHVITSLSLGGAEHLMVELLPRLRNLGYDVELAVFNSKKTFFYNQLENEGIRIHGFSDTDGVYNYNHIFRLKRLVSHYDIIHTHNTACQLFAAIVKTKNNILVTTEHSTSTRRRNYKPLWILDRWMYKQYDKIICIAESSEQSLRQYIGNNYPIITIQNGISIERFISAHKIELGVQGVKLITMVAGFRYEKDQPTLIRSLIHLPNDYHVVLVGDGQRRTEIESLISELKLNDRVHLLGLREDVPEILKSSDVIVMSSHREGLSLSNVEGLSSGNPFIASDVEGLREVTKGYGILFPHGDDKVLAKEILKVTTDENYRASIVKKCTKRAWQFDITKMVKKYSKIYEELYKARQISTVQ